MNNIISLFGISEQEIRKILPDTDSLGIVESDFGETKICCRDKAEADMVRGHFGEYIYSDRDESLEECLVRLLKESGKKAATAESLTGGLVSKRITGVPGASAVFECGICSYSNRIKNKILGVSDTTLKEYTEYSKKTAEEMAEGVRLLSGADIGVATSGVAGPGGGTDENPVGTVYIGVSRPGLCMAEKIFINAFTDNKREYIRRTASSYALFYAIKNI